MNSRQFTTPSRWAWSLPVAAAAVVVACSPDTFSTTDQTWGFTTVTALQVSPGHYKTSPQAMFFKGRLSTVPNASLVLDSCVDVNFSGGGNNLQDVTYLDAGDQVTASIGAVPVTLPRKQSNTTLTYENPTGQEVTYTPGDSIVVTVPGAVGGFPASTIRAKTAEPFTFDPITTPVNLDAIQLRWTAGQDLLGAFILELRYSPTGAATPSKELLCSYADDGIDSIPQRQYQPWTSSPAVGREIVATRLRTNFILVTGGIFEVISTFQRPTPAAP